MGTLFLQQLDKIKKISFYFQQRAFARSLSTLFIDVSIFTDSEGGNAWGEVRFQCASANRGNQNKNSKYLFNQKFSLYVKQRVCTQGTSNDYADDAKLV